ncbi:hypothetical protein PROFUN_00700 [Planoprotostelium fungivorum]|uniref:HNH nuclease domain-containing protein n=1 Tax=Planoprotostelium fungivorum TaxID=1890364 RepID=A0A2P6NU48_9EUKA|nr:hypothetical protein PROFUN_00700 [Planoprotostelium fungivorum]
MAELMAEIELLRKRAEDADMYETIFPGILEPWTESVISSPEERDSQFRKKVIAHYRQGKFRGRKRLVCHLSGEKHDKSLISAAHILPLCRSSLMPLYGLKEDTINSPRNNLLLCKPIEEAFDNRDCGVWDICFLRDLHNNFHMKIVNNTLAFANSPATPNNTPFKKLAGCKLEIPKGREPYHRILAHHAWQAHWEGVRKKYLEVADAEQYIPYHQFSWSGPDDSKWKEDLTRYMHHMRQKIKDKKDKV